MGSGQRSRLGIAASASLLQCSKNRFSKDNLWMIRYGLHLPV